MIKIQTLQVKQEKKRNLPIKGQNERGGFVNRTSDHSNKSQDLKYC